VTRKQHRRAARSSRVPAKKITVLLVEDHEVVRQGLRVLLDAERDITVIGEAHDGHQAVEMARTLRPDVVVMDIAMPRLNGLEATRQIVTTAPSTRVLLLSAHSDEAYVERASEVGAVGYLLKQSPLADLAGAIRESRIGAMYAKPSIAQRLRGPGATTSAREPSSKELPRLTTREAEVLQRIVEGRANKETAVELGISVKTVEKHRQSLMSKLDIHDVAGLTHYAISRGVVRCAGRPADF
jgi:two-component system, NarL family, nitrate/nitrite response regulator NarL